MRNKKVNERTNDGSVTESVEKRFPPFIRCIRGPNPTQPTRYCWTGRSRHLCGDVFIKCRQYDYDTRDNVRLTVDGSQISLKINEGKANEKQLKAGYAQKSGGRDGDVRPAGRDEKVYGGICEEGRF